MNTQLLSAWYPFLVPEGDRNQTIECLKEISSEFYLMEIVAFQCILVLFRGYFTEVSQLKGIMLITKI